MANKNGVAAYVDTSKEGVRLCKTFGFVDFIEPNKNSVASMARGRISQDE